MSFEEFKAFVHVELSGWDAKEDLCEQEDGTVTASMHLWGHAISDVFAFYEGLWFAENGGGIVVVCPATFWQWVAMRLADKIDSTNQKP